ncbi:hypothetical protein OIO90_001718 [Microbotryomycetes sp. JL221]|nr:hypothetical protein OIO90_001718 [Microbotryomycetes sp. JL221]
MLSEKRSLSGTTTPPKGATQGMDKPEVRMLDEVAVDGHTAVDAHGNPIYVYNKEAERKLRWKIDLHVIPIVALSYLFCFIDRANIGNARVAGLERDLGILPPTYGGYGYNLILTSFYIAYVIAEIPSNLLCKVIGPGRFMPLLIFLFGLFSLCFAFVNNFGQAFAVRFLLGLAEAGVLPGFAFYLSRWYRKDELGFRLAMYIVCAPLAGAFGGLLASGFLSTDGFGVVRTWRIIFFAEGLITVGISIAAFFLMTDRPSVARWLNEEEKALAIARVKSENVGVTEHVEKMKGKVVWRAMTSPTTLAITVIFLFDNIIVQGVGFFSPSIVRSIYPDAGTIEVQLRTVPPYVVGAFFTLLVPYLSWKFKKRGLFMIISAPFMILGYALFVGTLNPQARYAGTFFVAIGAFSFGALVNAWASANVTTDSARAASVGMVVFGGNIGGLASTWTFVPSQNPRQVPGNTLNLVGSVIILFTAAGLWAWQIRQNKLRDQNRQDGVLEGLTSEEIAALGDKHPAFRYRY